MKPVRSGAWQCKVLVAAAAMHLGAASAQQPLHDDPSLARAWQALRTVNCERCHGPAYTGLAAPSIVDYARTRDRAAFVRMVLEGDPPRGMPGYGGNPLVADNIDGIHRYFLGRADRSIEAADRPGRVSGP